MKLHYVLPFLAVLATSTLSAQVQDDDMVPVIRVDQEPAPDPNEPFTIVEEMPSFPGGQEALMKYIAKEMKYPEEAVENQIQGAVFVTFVVEVDGRISDLKVLRGIRYGCDEEALRVVKGMPKWTPGKQRGKEVRVQYNLPIRFKL
jgi:protein TonB